MLFRRRNSSWNLLLSERNLLLFIGHGRNTLINDIPHGLLEVLHVCSSFGCLLNGLVRAGGERNRTWVCNCIFGWIRSTETHLFIASSWAVYVISLNKSRWTWTSQPRRNFFSCLLLWKCHGFLRDRFFYNFRRWRRSVPCRCWSLLFFQQRTIICTFRSFLLIFWIRIVHKLLFVRNHRLCTTWPLRSITYWLVLKLLRCLGMFKQKTFLLIRPHRSTMLDRIRINHLLHSSNWTTLLKPCYTGIILFLLRFRTCHVCYLCTCLTWSFYF